MRPVRETLHTRTSYEVDFYTLYTGLVEPCSLATPEGELTYLRLVQPLEVVTCADCYRRPAIRAERERSFQPERYATAEE